MMLMLSASFLVLNGFGTALVSYSFIGAGAENNEQLASRMFWDNLGQMPVILNNSCNLVFYLISGPTFRQAFVKSFTAISPVKKT